MRARTIVHVQLTTTEAALISAVQVTPRAMVRSSRRLASPSTSSRTATLSPTMGKDPTSVEAQKLAIELDPLRTDPRPGVTLSLLTSRSEEHTSELQSLTNLVCRLLP